MKERKDNAISFPLVEVVVILKRKVDYLVWFAEVSTMVTWSMSNFVKSEFNYLLRDMDLMYCKEDCINWLIEKFAFPSGGQQYFPLFKCFHPILPDLALIPPYRCSPPPSAHVHAPTLERCLWAYRSTQRESNRFLCAPRKCSLILKFSKATRCKALISRQQLLNQGSQGSRSFQNLQRQNYHCSDTASNWM